jgi:regulatory protein
VPTVTGLREDRRGRVAVELDGSTWRTLPVEVVARAGLTEGRTLDRNALRTVRRELRRAEALAVATRALRARDLTEHELKVRLEQRGVLETAARDSMAALVTAGLVDDARAASGRAGSLAARGYGDAAIREDLERRGVAAEVVEGALQELDPEGVRARQIVEERGTGPRTARHLSARGFAAEAVEEACGRDFGHGP